MILKIIYIIFITWHLLVSCLSNKKIPIDEYSIMLVFGYKLKWYIYFFFQNYTIFFKYFNLKLNINQNIYKCNDNDNSSIHYILIHS